MNINQRFDCLVILFVRVLHVHVHCRAIQLNFLIHGTRGDSNPNVTARAKIWMDLYALE